MKLILLAGGLGTRFAEETHLKPKPMIEIGGMPIIWHIMKYYSVFGINEFLILGGYKCYVIKEFFANYCLHTSNVSFDLRNNSIEILDNRSEAWKVTIIDTGENTLTGGRLKRASNFLQPGEDFCMTYGDGLSNIDIKRLIRFHKNGNKLATISAVIPPARFGAINMEADGSVSQFMEKPTGNGNWINGGFFVLNKAVLDYITGDETSFETGPLEQLIFQKELQAFLHSGFWQPMDTLRDKINLESLWNSGKAPWHIWPNEPH